jgi:hypothetical protein
MATDGHRTRRRAAPRHREPVLSSRHLELGRGPRPKPGEQEPAEEFPACQPPDTWTPPRFIAPYRRLATMKKIEVRGGTATRRKKALVYDAQRKGPVSIPCTRVHAFGTARSLDELGTRKLGQAVPYAGSPPPRPRDDEAADLPASVVETDVKLRFGSRKTARFPYRVRTVSPPARDGRALRETCVALGAPARRLVRKGASTRFRSPQRPAGKRNWRWAGRPVARDEPGWGCW